eukprot:comp22068_c1_seq1/m.32137 comp22068_c1_seq1/g.32137  ORF comp22068_c1_seq1/g.32137 comp22068_c1_seq1/m.32137 type:complete len:262 (-) comp22068_c1_seq1:124-909(-)
MSPAATSPSVKLLSAWFCPYAQRAWVAIGEKGLERDADYELIECLEVSEDVYKKKPLLLEANPKGLVPVILDQRPGRNEEDAASATHLGTVVIESLVVMEYLDEAFSTGRNLMPTCPGKRAKTRVWFDAINRTICTPFYQALIRQEEADQKKAIEDLTNGLSAFAKELHGLYFFGEEFSAVDIAILPWVYRLYLLEHHRGFSMPNTPEFDKLRTWMDATFSRPAVKATLADKEQLLKMYARYARGSVQSKVGEAIRAGKTV